jgi:hypothetical protein
MATIDKTFLSRRMAQHAAIQWMIDLGRHYLDKRKKKAQRAHLKSVMGKLSPELRADIGLGRGPWSGTRHEN